MNKTRPNKQANEKKIKPNPTFFINLVKKTIYFFFFSGLKVARQKKNKGKKHGKSGMAPSEVILRGKFTAEFLPCSGSGWSRLKHSEACETTETQFLKHTLTDHFCQPGFS